jgi:phage head maturation protease
MLKAVSVGFSPTVPPEPMLNKDGAVTGFRYIGQRLLELSVVGIPANPNALAIAKSHGLRENEINRLFTKSNAGILRNYKAQIDLLKLKR